MTRIRLPRPGLHTRRAVVAALVVIGSALALPSSAAPSSEPDLPEIGSSATDEFGAPVASRPGAGELPTNEGYNIVGEVTSTQGAVTRRSKMYITLGQDNPIIGVLQLGRNNDPIEDPVKYDANVAQVDWPFGEVACATVPPSQYGRHTRLTLAEVTPVTITPQGKPVEVGALPAARVRLLAFGSVPATVTLNMRVARKADEPASWSVLSWSPGSTQFPGCSNSNRYFRTLLTGQAEITLSDLAVDGVPVELGPSCRTTHPVELNVWGVSPYTPILGGPMGQYDGLTDWTGAPMTSTGPLSSPYYEEHEGRRLAAPTGVDIPPFTGCGVGGEDLSPMVTAMASGPNNPVRVNQAGLMYTPLDPENLLKCDAVKCPLPAPETPEMPPLPDGETP